jgi:hypothetical protein
MNSIVWGSEAPPANEYGNPTGTGEKQGTPEPLIICFEE